MDAGSTAITQISVIGEAVIHASIFPMLLLSVFDEEG